MENSNITTLETNIGKIPSSFFLISICIITLAIVTFFSISLLIGYADDYSIHTFISQEKSDTILIHNLSSIEFGEFRINQKIQIQFPYSSKIINENGVVVSIRNKNKIIAIKESSDLEQLLNTSTNKAIYCVIKFKGVRKSLLERIISNSKMQSLNK